MKIICIKKGENPMDKLRVPPAPLYRDPIYDSPTDPVVIYNREEKCFWMLYTQRRATEFNIGVSTVHGTKIGVASSNDGIRWLYRGTLPNLDFEPGTNTFWAPEVIYAGGKYHMYVSYVRGVPTDWKWERHIIHYSAVNMWDWKFESVLPLSSDRVIDACVYEISQGVFKMWYKDEANHSHTYSAISEDLYHWKVLGPEVTDVPHEGPNVFEFGGVKWLITDHWSGLEFIRRTISPCGRVKRTSLMNPAAETGTMRPDIMPILLYAMERLIFFILHIPTVRLHRLKGGFARVYRWPGSPQMV